MPFAQVVALADAERRKLLPGACPGGLQLRHPALFDPRIGPRNQVGFRSARVSANQIAPFSVCVRVFTQIGPDAFARGVLPDMERQKPQKTGRFFVNDRAIRRFRVLQIRDLLVDWRGPMRAVDLISRWFDGFVEALPDRPGRLHFRLGMVRNVLGKAFLQPQIVEPSHRDQVAEPLVGEFMEHGYFATVVVVRGRHGAEQDRVFV